MFLPAESYCSGLLCFSCWYSIPSTWSWQSTDNNSRYISCLRKKCQNWAVLSIMIFLILPTNNLNYKITSGLAPLFPGKIISLVLSGGETLRDGGIAGACTCRVNGDSYTEQISLNICWSLVFTNGKLLLLQLYGATAFDLPEGVSWCSIT